MSSSPPNEFESGAFPGTFQSAAPNIAVVLGSGLASFVDKLEILDTIAFAEIPGLPASTVPGHEGRFLLGRLKGTSETILVAQGRVHLYEGHGANVVTAGVRAMASLGVQRLILTNAAGSANSNFAPGHWMSLRDHLNLTGASPLLGGPHFIDMSEVYSSALRRHFQNAATARNVTLYEGVYAGLPGPQYETPAEVAMLQRLGADAVGMSTVLEAIQARALGMEVAGFSCLTNWGAGLGKEALSHTEVLEAGARTAGVLVDLLVDGLKNL